MNIFADYHTHTIYSHGKGSIEDNVKAGIKLGLKEIAITDHGPGHIFYGMKRKDFKKMREEIDSINEKYPQIKVLMGVEANIISLNGDIDVKDELMQYLDILLMGYHEGVMPKDFKSAIYLFGKNYLGKYSKTLMEETRESNTQAMINAIKKYKIDIITHPGAKVNINTKILSKAAGERDTALEINASHGYMTVEYIKIAKKENCKFVINSDAHTPSRVGDFKRGLDIAEEAGLTWKDIINAKE